MSQRSRDTLDTRIDERLARLLEVERRVEAQVRAAEQEARARVAAARAAVRRADDDGREALEAAWALEDAEARARHAETMRRLEAEGEASLAGLATPSPERIERLAWRALDLVVHSDTRSDGRPP
jgi:membrane protein involved in colicin uptake